MFDMLASAIAIVVLSPVILVTGALVAASLGRPVLYAQRRPGKEGRPFTIRKFRTMTDARGADGQLLPDADRMTAVGRFIRSTSLDELPSLWNVLRGDMSLVGPRPLLMRYLDRYTAEQARRHEVRPGLTGWAQVNGRNALSWDERFAMDVWYVDHRSFLLDLRILALTVKRVVQRHGINAPGEATMPEFRGTDSGRGRTPPAAGGSS